MYNVPNYKLGDIKRYENVFYSPGYGADMPFGKVLFFHRMQRPNNRIYFSAAAQKVEALFVSTYFCLFIYLSTKYPLKRAPGTKQVCAFYLLKCCADSFTFSFSKYDPGCRSPPFDFDFASQPKNRNWRNYP